LKKKKEERKYLQFFELLLRYKLQDFRTNRIFPGISKMIHSCMTLEMVVIFCQSNNSISSLRL